MLIENTKDKNMVLEINGEIDVAVKPKHWVSIEECLKSKDYSAKIRTIKIK